MSKVEDRSEAQARSQLASICDLIHTHNSAWTAEERDASYDAIMEDPLEVAVRSGWSAPYGDLTPKEYNILLCTGGPAVRITGDLEEGHAVTAHIEHQDWFVPWERLHDITEQEQDALLEYASFFFHD